jgi:hypothetical protein
MEQWELTIWSGLVGALIGACVGAFFTSLGQYIFSKRHTIELEKKEVLNLTKAINIELTTLWNKYMDFAGKEIEKADTNESPPLIKLFEPSQNYFTIYDNSSGSLKLFDPEIAEKIIKTYIEAKALFSELVYYGKLSQRHDEANSGTILKYDELQITYSQMVNFFHFLKDRHIQVKELFISTIEKIREIIGR